MNKDQFQDIVMPSQRKAKTTAGIHPPQRTHKPQHSEPVEYDRKSSKYPIWILAIASVIVLIAIFVFFYSGVTLKITQKADAVFIDGTFSASASQDSTLPYEVITIEKTASKTLNATEQEEVEEFAKGVIIIFNDFNGSPQRLIKNTRFETPDGKIYRISESVTVPGQTTKGGETVPGSIEAEVYASSSAGPSPEAGAEYNIGLTDFKLPGFRDDSPARYETFFARSKTPMQGGFKGTRLVVPSSELDSTQEQLRAELSEDLKNEIIAQSPQGFTLFEDSFRYIYESLPNIDGSGQTEVVEKGTLYAIIFDQTKLAEFIASNTLPDYDQSPITITNAETLDVVFIETDLPLWESDGLSFTINGTANLLWTFTEAELQNAVSGRSKDELPQILSSYDGIERAEAIIRPFWNSQFPQNPEEIKIEFIR